MAADRDGAEGRALILLFRENAIPMSDRNSFLFTILEDALSTPVAAQPAASGVDAQMVDRPLWERDLIESDRRRDAEQSRASLTGAAKETK